MPLCRAKNVVEATLTLSQFYNGTMTTTFCTIH